MEKFTKSDIIFHLTFSVLGIATLVMSIDNLYIKNEFGFNYDIKYTVGVLSILFSIFILIFISLEIALSIWGTITSIKEVRKAKVDKNKLNEKRKSN